MNELSLFTGAGGGLLGTHLLGWRPIGYVEFNDYCQRVIAQRIADGILPNAPIFGDVREFVQSGAAREYRGFADVVTGGFPCQPFSVAGKRAGADDARNMWPATIATVREVRPRYCFFENVPGLLASGYFERILCDLTESGYSVRWRCLSAAELGAPHKRDRLWIVAHTERNGWGRRENPVTRGTPKERGRDGETGSNQSQLCGQDVAYAESQQDRRVQQQQLQPHFGASGELMAHTNGSGFAESRPIGGRSQKSSTESCGNKRRWWESEPNVGRVAHGVAARVDRLKAAGNGQVPAVAATAWHLLTEGLL